MCICHFFGSHWALASSLCWGGVTEESPLWLQQPGTPTWSARWLYGDPMPSFLSTTSSFTKVLLLYLSSSWVTVQTVHVIIFPLCVHVFCGNAQRSVMSQSGVRGWGSPWRRCMEQKSLLKPGRPGWMGSHSLLTDQKVVTSSCYRLIKQDK